MKRAWLLCVLGVVPLGCELLGATLFGERAPEGPAPDYPGYQEIAWNYSADHGGLAMSVLVKGVRLFEGVAGGGRSQEALPLGAGVEGLVCGLAAAAAHDGLLGLDERVSATIREWRRAEGKREITVRQLLDGTSGLDAGGEAASLKALLRAPLAEEPGLAFRWGPDAQRVFVELMRRKLSRAKGPAAGEDPLAYLQRRALAPVGASAEPDPEAGLGPGVRMTALDWARYGELIRRRGSWVGQRLLDRDVIQRCFVGSYPNPAFGLGWWLLEPVEPELQERLAGLAPRMDFLGPAARPLPRDLAIAAGAGGQRLYIAPSLSLVVARHGATDDFSDIEFLSRLLYGRNRFGDPVAR